MVLKFSKEVRKRLKYYAYRLVDPRDGETFYVGKGKDNRVFSHANAEARRKSEDVSDPKLKRIREIRSVGFEVDHIIHRHGLNNENALEVEAVLIDAYPDALNKYGGRHSYEYGTMHAKQVIRQYQAAKTVFKHNVLMFTINHTASGADIYKAVRFAWKLDIKRAKKAEYVLAMQNGLVVGVFVPKKWLEATKSNFPDRGDSPGRWGFKGKKAPEDIWNFYIDTRLPDSMRRKGAANPVRYSYSY